MKSGCLLLFVFVLLSGTVCSQSNKYCLGIEGGPSYASFRGNDFVEKYYDHGIGFAAEIAFQYRLSNLISLRTDLAFERKGAISKINIINEVGQELGESKIHNRFDYLTLPLLVRLEIGKKVKFFANVGPYFGYLLKQTWIIEAIDQYPRQKVDNTDSYRKHDLGICGGIGVLYPLNEKFLISFEIRDNLGLYKIIDAEVVNNGTLLTNSSNALFGIVYKFGPAI